MNMAINCGFEDKGEITWFSRLSHNEKRELFFWILWDKIKPSYFFDGLDNSEQDIKNIDHISFHKDGTIHIRFYDQSSNADKIIHTKLVNTILGMEQDKYGPLLTISIYDSNLFKKFIGKDDPVVFNKFQHTQLKWDIEGIEKFSLVFFLVGGHINHRLMLEKNFPGMFNMGASPYLMNFFGDDSKLEMENGEVKKVNDLGLLVAFTTKTIPRPPKEAITGTRKFDRIEIPLGINITPSDEKIRRMT